MHGEEPAFSQILGRRVTLQECQEPREILWFPTD